MRVYTPPASEIANHVWVFFACFFVPCTDPWLLLPMTCIVPRLLELHVTAPCRQVMLCNSVNHLVLYLSTQCVQELFSYINKFM